MFEKEGDHRRRINENRGLLDISVHLNKGFEEIEDDFNEEELFSSTQLSVMVEGGCQDVADEFSSNPSFAPSNSIASQKSILPRHLTASTLSSTVAFNASLGSVLALDPSHRSSIDANTSIGSNLTLNQSFGSNLALTQSIVRNLALDKGLGSNLAQDVSLGPNLSLNQSVCPNFAVNQSVVPNIAFNPSSGSSLVLDPSLGSNIALEPVPGSNLALDPSLFAGDKVCKEGHGSIIDSSISEPSVSSILAPSIDLAYSPMDDYDCDENNIFFAKQDVENIPPVSSSSGARQSHGAAVDEDGEVRQDGNQEEEEEEDEDQDEEEEDGEDHQVEDQDEEDAPAEDAPAEDGADREAANDQKNNGDLNNEGNWLTYDELMLDSYPAKSKMIYLKAYKQFERYLKSKKQFIPNVAPTELQILNYFYHLKNERNLAPTTLWSTYARINACVKRLYGFSLKSYVRVSDVLKSYESGYMVKKASTFTPQEVWLSIKVTLVLVRFIDCFLILI